MEGNGKISFEFDATKPSQEFHLEIFKCKKKHKINVKCSFK